MVVVTFLALASILAVAIGAFLVVDERALQSVNAEPQMLQAKKQRTPPASSNHTSALAGGSRADQGTPVSRIASSPAPDTMLDSRYNHRKHAHHASSKRPAQDASASRTASSAGPPPGSQPTITGETGPAPDSPQNHRRHAHRGSQNLDGRLTRLPSQGTDGGGSSALFFPFR
jgi:hypothetical protein